MIRHRHAKLCLLVPAFLLMMACGPSSPAEKVAAIRAEYRVQLNTFKVQEPEPVEIPSEEMPMEGDEAGAAEESAGEEVDGEIDEVDLVASEEPLSADVLLDLYVQFNGKESLDGITIDISMADPFQKEKGTFRRYLDIGKMARGEGRQLSVVLEGLEDFETGDVFSVFVRASVPEGEQGDYPEYAGFGS